MKPFSIKEHLEHPDWKVVTREGEPVRILCTDLDDDDYPVAAATKKTVMLIDTRQTAYSRPARRLNMTYSSTSRRSRYGRSLSSVQVISF